MKKSYFNCIFKLVPIVCLTPLFFITTARSLKVGDKAPHFSLKDQYGNVHNLKQYAGKKIALYFYPADGASHCTAQACSVRDNYSQLEEEGIVVLGLSGGSAERKQTFSQKHNLSFPLLQATSNVLSAYNAKGIFFISRLTYLINEDGIIIAIIKKIDAKNHAQQIINVFKSTPFKKTFFKEKNVTKKTAVIYLHEQEPIKSSGNNALNNMIINNKNVIVIFYEDWCGPCKQMAPILEELAQEMPHIVFVKVKRELYRPIFDRLISEPFKQSTVPAMLLFKNGTLVKHQLSSAPKNSLVAVINKSYKEETLIV